MLESLVEYIKNIYKKKLNNSVLQTEDYLIIEIVSPGTIYDWDDPEFTGMMLIKKDKE